MDNSSLTTVVIGMLGGAVAALFSALMLVMNDRIKELKEQVKAMQESRDNREQVVLDVVRPMPSVLQTINESQREMLRLLFARGTPADRGS